MTTRPLRRTARLTTETSDPSPRPLIALENLEPGTGRLIPRVELMEAPSPTPGVADVEIGDVLFGKLRPYLGKTWVADRQVRASTELLCLRPEAGIDSRWLGYVVASSPCIAWAVATSDGTKMPRTSWEKLSEFRVVTPPAASQRVIADYLDCETAQLDTLIEKKTRLMLMLEERWTTLRLHLTGVGDVVSRGQGIQVRRIARLQAGAAFPHDRQGAMDGTLPYVKVGDLASADENETLHGAANYVTPEVAAALRSPVLPAGTIVLPKIGAALLTNRRAILGQPSCLDQNVLGVTVTSGSARFVYYCLSSIDLGDLSAPGPVPLLNEDAAKSIRLPWPGPREQDAIVDALDAYRAALRAPARILAKQLVLLQERRQALITAVVTGQFDVAAVAA